MDDDYTGEVRFADSTRVCLQCFEGNHGKCHIHIQDGCLCECPDINTAPLHPGQKPDLTAIPALRELLAACIKVRWEDGEVNELLGQFFDGEGFDMSIPGADPYPVDRPATAPKSRHYSELMKRTIAREG
jgi:hypothetical protein